MKIMLFDTTSKKNLSFSMRFIECRREILLRKDLKKKDVEVKNIAKLFL